MDKTFSKTSSRFFKKPNTTSGNEKMWSLK